MKIEITKVTTWNRVLNAARFTVGKEPIDKEPSQAFKTRMVYSEHSPIRLLEFDIKIYDAPSYVAMHLVRHKIGFEPFVATSRPDRTGKKVSRHDQRKDDPTNFQMSVNAAALIAVSRKRLCRHAESTTRELWRQIIDKLAESEPILASVCVPECVYRGFCPEGSTCGFSLSGIFKAARMQYITGIFDVQNNDKLK